MWMVTMTSMSVRFTEDGVTQKWGGGIVSKYSLYPKQLINNYWNLDVCRFGIRSFTHAKSRSGHANVTASVLNKTLPKYS